MNGESRPEGRPSLGSGRDTASTGYGPEPIQQTFFDAVGKVRKTDPDTSRQAARRVRVPQQEHAILWALSSASGPLTGDDLADRTGIRVDVVRTRLPQLRRKGLAYVHGRGPARGVRDGSVMTWALTGAGMEAARSLKAS